MVKTTTKLPYRRYLKINGIKDQLNSDEADGTGLQCNIINISVDTKIHQNQLNYT